MSVSAPATSAAAPKVKRRLDFRPVYLVGPALLVLAAIIAYPIINAVWHSTLSNSGLDPTTGMFESGSKSVGFDHYRDWLVNQCLTNTGQKVTCPPGNVIHNFWPSVWNTLILTVITVALETVIGIWMAVIMSRNVFGRSLLRVAVLVPWAIPTAVTAKLWAFMFAPDGIVNAVLPGSDIGWTTEFWPSRFAVIFADVWKTAPFMALLIMAGLQMIPKDVYEAARVDGANTWQRFTRITLPLVKPALAVAILFRTLDALRMYDLPQIMIGPATDRSTTTISQVIASIATGDKANQAAALSTMLFLAIFVIAFLLIKVLGANVVATQEKQRKGEI